ncbi:MAG: Gfo/Idh/MocA family oxidoreductase [Phycisphaeraceae bacterium]|nr:Gfo/Idh/MocA family oxidoreductase [Phycisphaeraceae bacterium]
MTNDRMQVAVIGVGRMGRNHVKALGRLPQAELVAVVDAQAERAAEVAGEVGCRWYDDVERLLDAEKNLCAATVAVPTVGHYELAMRLLDRKIPCLVEKPLATTSAQARQLAERADAQGVALQVGHTERFNPAVQAVLGMGMVPRFLEVHRVSPLTFRSLDVSVVMDMMIHDLDIVLKLVGSPLGEVQATGVAVIGEKEDVAHARLVFASGCVANLTASRLALKTERKIRIFSESAYVSLDYQKRDGLVIRKSDNAEALAKARQELMAGTDMSNLDYSELVRVEHLLMDDTPSKQDPLTAELADFLKAVQSGGRPHVDGWAGYAAVEAAERVMQSIRGHRWEGLTELTI